MNKRNKQDLLNVFITIQSFLFIIFIIVEIYSPIWIGLLDVSLLYIAYFLLFSAIASTKSWLHDSKKSQTRSQWYIVAGLWIFFIIAFYFLIEPIFWILLI
jgi:hypothetical protein